MQKRSIHVPPGLTDFTESLVRQAESIEGFLSPREMSFLSMVGAIPTAEGEILEIGSFKGRSTVILAKASEIAGDARVNAVDPMTAPSETDPDLRGDESSFADFTANLEKHGVADRVRLHRTFSYELAKEWNAPIRLLWIDGDHTYDGTKADLEGFVSHLAEGAIVAIHDVLHEFEGGIRVFIEDILLSPNFAACGFCGSIAWGQFTRGSEKVTAWRGRKLGLYKKAARLVPYVSLDKKLAGWEKKVYKLLRSRVPRSAVDPAEWIEMIR